MESLQAKNCDNKKLKALQSGLAGTTFDFEAMIKDSEGKMPALSCPSGSAGPAAAAADPSVEIFESKALVSDFHWQKCSQMYDLLEKVDKEGGKMYQKLQDMETTQKLEGSGTNLLNQLEDIYIYQGSIHGGPLKIDVAIRPWK